MRVALRQWVAHHRHHQCNDATNVMKHLYPYQAAVLGVTDGDTFTAMIDLGFDVYIEKKVRLYGIDAYEKNTEKGKRAKSRLKELIEGKQVLLIAVTHTDKFGRFLARCLLDNVPDSKEVVSDVTDILLEEGLGYEYHGGKKRPDVS